VFTLNTDFDSENSLKTDFVLRARLEEIDAARELC
jgi:hypothetical protein